MKNFKSDKPCIVCGESRDGFVCFHHIRSRKAGGSDHPANLLSLCQRCHNEVHAIGNLAFMQKHPSVKSWMESNGWEALKGKLINQSI
jgi:5-methylcytosine-specific restriction endonuclease McrA